MLCGIDGVIVVQLTKLLLFKIVIVAVFTFMVDVLILSASILFNPSND